MMADLKSLFKKIFKEGDEIERVQQKACQDIFISRLANTIEWKDRVIIKGGAAMYELTNDRGYTRDIDMDFIKTSISQSKVQELIDSMNESSLFEGITISIDSSKALKQKTYRGNRVVLSFQDLEMERYSLTIDVGVHTVTDAPPIEREYRVKCGDTRVIIQVDPNELSIAEKMVPLIVYGPSTTRFKDIYDLDWRTRQSNINIKKVKQWLLEKLSSHDIHDSMSVIYNNIKETFQNANFLSGLSGESNWTKHSQSEIIDQILEFSKLLVSSE